MSIAGYFDHTLLKPDITIEDVRRLCAEAVEHKFAGVCVPPTMFLMPFKHLVEQA